MRVATCTLMIGQLFRTEVLDMARPAKRGKMRLVSLNGERGAFKCEVRTLPSSGMAPGDIVWVEFGGFLLEQSGARVRYEGQWQCCIVEPSTDDALCVRLLTPRRAEPGSRPNGLPERRRTP